MTERIMDSILTHGAKQNLLREWLKMLLNVCCAFQTALNLSSLWNACSVYSLMCNFFSLLSLFWCVSSEPNRSLFPRTSWLWLVAWFGAKISQLGRTELHHIHTVGTLELQGVICSVTLLSLDTALEYFAVTDVMCVCGRERSSSQSTGIKADVVGCGCKYADQRW